MDIFTSHPKFVTLGIALAITFVVGTAIGLVEHSSVYAIAKGGPFKLYLLPHLGPMQLQGVKNCWKHCYAIWKWNS